jgi:hypothetical protein
MRLGFSLFDFSDKSSGYSCAGVDGSVFDKKYPHGIPPAPNRTYIGNTPQVRSGDRVQVVFLHDDENQQRHVPVWIKVWSLTAFAMLAGHIIAKLDNTVSSRRQGKFIAFLVIKDLGVVHGDKCKRKLRHMIGGDFLLCIF